jgi:hypothetical protein
VIWSIFDHFSSRSGTATFILFGIRIQSSSPTSREDRAVSRVCCYAAQVLHKSTQPARLIGPIVYFYQRSLVWLTTRFCTFQEGY